MRTISLSKIEISDSPFEERKVDNLITVPAMDLKFAAPANPNDALEDMLKKVHSWRGGGFTVLVATGTQAQSQRLLAFFEKSQLTAQMIKESDHEIAAWVAEQRENVNLIHIIPRALNESLRLTDEQIIFLRDEDFFGKKQNRRREYKQTGTLQERTNTLAFADLKPGDSIVHVQHGIGTYEGLKVMQIGGVDAEFITLSYKDNDKLYLPIYRIGQITKYSGPKGEHLMDKLGGTGWAKTKIRVRGHLRELAAELLQLYAKRSQVHRPPFPSNDDDFSKFEGSFPYDETNDQLRAVDDIVKDMTSDKPMDRLVCGDRRFGKTEVAMRAGVQGDRRS